MKCTEFELLVNEYVDNEIEDKNIEEHLKTCESCQKLYEETLEIKNLLSDLEPLDLPDDFEETLHDKLVEVKQEMKVLPLTSRFKVIGSIAAVAVLSILAFRAGTLMPLDGNSDDNMMATANVAYEMDMDTEETESMEMNDMAMEEEAGDMSIVYSSNAKALRMDVPNKYAKESITYFISPIESKLFDEMWLEGFEYIELIYLEPNVELYIHEADFEAFNDMMFYNLIVENSVILDNTAFIDETLVVYGESTANLDKLKEDIKTATDNEKVEIEEDIEFESGQIDAIEYDVKNIEHYKTYKKVIIKWED